MTHITKRLFAKRTGIAFVFLSPLAAPKGAAIVFSRPQRHGQAWIDVNGNYPKRYVRLLFDDDIVLNFGDACDIARDLTGMLFLSGGADKAAELDNTLVGLNADREDA